MVGLRGASRREREMAGEKVLIVDDRVENIEFIVDYVLKPHGYTHAAARDGAEGLRLARKERPDLMLLDMNMPKLNGIEVLEALRSEKIQIPVIMMTFHGSETLAVAAFRLGIRDYIVKPFQVEEMLEAIERALTEVRLRRERDELTARLVKVNRQLEQRVRELNALFGIGKSVTAVLDLEKVLSRLVEAAVYLTNAEEGSLLLVDKQTDELYMLAAQGFEDRIARAFRLRVEDSLAGRVVKTGEPLILHSDETHRIKTSYLVKALVYVPLKVKDRVSGVLGVDNRQTDRRFTQHDKQLLSALADYAAIALENARLFGEVGDERAKLATILGSAEEPVLVTSGPDNRVLLANAAARRAFGLSATGEEGRPLAKLINNRQLAEFVAGVPEASPAQKDEIFLDDGRVFYATLTPIPDVGHAIIMQDITHLKELDRMKTEFVSTVSHDLRSPLTSMTGYVHMLSAVGPLNEKQQEFIARIVRGADHMAELINDLLDIGKIEAGLEMALVACDLGDMTREMIEQLKGQAAGKSHKLVYQGPAQPAMVLGDKLRLRQVINNLIGNAIKYTPAGGEIDATVQVKDSLALLSIEDNGIGIPPADLPYIFDKFYRVEAQETADIQGTGLGLAICKSVVEKHGGRIWAESERGKGSIFRVALPRLARSTT
jgi:two-component system phosphate regulon sensor histidine kinase PhoR